MTFREHIFYKKNLMDATWKCKEINGTIVRRLELKFAMKLVRSTSS